MAAGCLGLGHPGVVKSLENDSRKRWIEMGVGVGVGGGGESPEVEGAK